LGLPISVQALGFGAPILKSHLNEILDVRVPLFLAEGESLNSVIISFAKPNEYQLVGLEPYTDISSIRVSIKHMQYNKLYVVLSSVSVIQTPIISLLLKARIGHNTYYKQVQLLFDTMELGAKTHAVTKHQPHSRLQTTITPQSTPQNPQGWARLWRYGPVRSGDSLSTIAYRLRRDKQWSNHDVMLALYRFNPDAFIQHDINRLRSGVWLGVPHKEKLTELLKQPPKAYEKRYTKLHTTTKKITPNLKPKQTSMDNHESTSASQLRYVGRIALGNKLHPSSSQSNLEKDSSQLHKKLDQLYQQAMNDHLQMTGLGKDLTKIRHDIDTLSSNILALKEQQTMIQKQIAHSPTSQYWMQGFLLLLVLNIIVIGLFLYRRYQEKAKEKYDIEDVYFNKKTPEPEAVEEIIVEPLQTKKRNKHFLENKIYDIENYLNIKDYDAVEDILSQLNQAERNHFGVCALKARLYHETERLDERDALIRKKQVSLNEQQWLLLCDRLPTNIWHALYEAGVIKNNGPLLQHLDESPTEDPKEEVKYETDSLSIEQPDLDSLKPETVNTDESETTIDTAIPLIEDIDIPATSLPIDEIENDFLELNDHEFKTTDNHQPSSEEDDEFVSTVFISTADAKKRPSK